jgi:predicted RNA-binding Zn ribbon-like protein
VTPATARELARLAASRPVEAREALTNATELREAMYGLFAAIANRRAPRPADLAALNEQVPAAFTRSRVVDRDRRLGADRRFVLTCDADSGDLRAPLVAVTRSAVDLLTSSDIERVRTCAAETCVWLFLDLTKNRTRRWCDMKVCGNRAKVRRFRRGAR